eukprot:CAMPEP_0184867896 /NCGR_PEP_ID=MMETSP0580-20130426/28176_1 /TAXON_ID=1118495 /ORGANISM="Dactyliosolen fragilissimus" /LENGTH=87 /DNA_ID=CAMNT_0027368407 /DNA_START=174 /DNA_END=437 /DNA_ORIENTATION=-
MPSPFSFLKRLAKVESRLKELSIDCKELSQRRAYVAAMATEMLLNNARDIKELSSLAEGSIDDGVIVDTLSDDISNQNKIWQSKVED